MPPSSPLPTAASPAPAASPTLPWAAPPWLLSLPPPSPRPSGPRHQHPSPRPRYVPAGVSSRKRPCLLTSSDSFAPGGVSGSRRPSVLPVWGGDRRPGASTLQSSAMPRSTPTPPSAPSMQVPHRAALPFIQGGPALTDARSCRFSLQHKETAKAIELLEKALGVLRT